MAPAACIERYGRPEPRSLGGAVPSHDGGAARGQTRRDPTEMRQHTVPVAVRAGGGAASASPPAHSPMRTALSNSVNQAATNGQFGGHARAQFSIMSGCRLDSVKHCKQRRPPGWSPLAAGRRSACPPTPPPVPPLPRWRPTTPPRGATALPDAPSPHGVVAADAAGQGTTQGRAGESHAAARGGRSRSHRTCTVSSESHPRGWRPGPVRMELLEASYAERTETVWPCIVPKGPDTLGYGHASSFSFCCE